MQRSFPALSRFALLLEACGSWQLTQFPSRTTLCVLTALAGTTLVWHVRQMALVGAARSFPWFDACGLWHPAQSPVFTGVWTNLLLSLSWKSVWQSKQILPAAPGFNRYLFWPCAASSRKVALVTRSRPERHVDVGLEELRILRCVRIVTLPAVDDRRLDVEVRLGERRALRRVALEARRLDGLAQQGVLRREMRLVASLAISRRGRVGPLRPHPALQVLVAGEAKLRALRQEQVVQPRLVRVVALGAFGDRDGLMLALGGLGARLDLGVARGADGRQRAGRHALDVATVRRVAAEAHPGAERAVVNAPGDLLHEVGVALHAELAVGSLQQFLLATPVGRVARVAGPLRDRPVRVRLEKLRLGLGVAPIADAVEPLRRHPWRVRAVRVVARATLFLDERRVGHLALQGFPHLRVAGEAERAFLLVEEVLELRGVRGVAGQAAALADDGRVVHADRHALVVVAGHAELIAVRDGELTELRGVGGMTRRAHPVLERSVVHLAARPQLRRVVAVGAELVRRVGGPERVRGRGRVVADLALERDDRVVGARLQELHLRRGVRIVAPGARGGPLHGIRSVSLPERGLRRLVTGQTQGHRRLQQEVLLVGAVGRVAGEAALRRRGRVHDLPLVRFFLVAPVAGLAALGLHQVARRGAVRIVAVGAPAALEGRVDVLPVEPDLPPGMTLIAELVALLLHDGLGDQPVPQVARLALVCLHRGMEILHPEVLLGESLVAIEAVLLRELGFRRPSFQASGEQEEQEDEPDARRPRTRPARSSRIVPHRDEDARRLAGWSRLSRLEYLPQCDCSPARAPAGLASGLDARF